MSRRLFVGCLFVATAALTGAWAVSDGPVTPAERTVVVQRAADELERGYVFADIGRNMAEHLRRRLVDGAYEAMSDPQAFAETLTRDVRTVNDDGHLRIVVKGAGPSDNRAGGPPDRPAAVEGVQRLAGNVGYIRVNGFPPAEAIAPDLDRAMTTLKDTGALIVDLRTNGGGNPSGAMYLAGFFFDKPTLMARIYSRQGDTTTEMSTADVKGPVTAKSYNASVRKLKNIKTDMICKPWYVGNALPYHIPNNWDITVDYKGGKVVLKEKCFAIAPVDKEVAQTRVWEKKFKLNTGK